MQSPFVCLYQFSINYQVFQSGWQEGAQIPIHVNAWNFYIYYSSPCLVLPSPVLFLQTLAALVNPNPSSISSLRECARFSQIPPKMGSLETLLRQSLGSSHLFLTIQGYCPSLSDMQCLKNHLCIYFVQCFACLTWTGKSFFCYTIFTIFFLNHIVFLAQKSYSFYYFSKLHFDTQNGVLPLGRRRQHMGVIAEYCQIPKYLIRMVYALKLYY